MIGTLLPIALCHHLAGIRMGQVSVLVQVLRAEATIESFNQRIVGRFSVRKLIVIVTSKLSNGA
jgi:hypothetical protein